MGQHNFKPLLKYPGGKTSELRYIQEKLPENINNYIEPFVGGGAVFFDIENNHNYINDKSSELILLYRYIAEHNEEFFDELETINTNWERLGNLRYKEEISNIYLNFRLVNELDEQGHLFEVIDEIILDEPMFNIISVDKFRENLKKCIIEKLKSIKKNESKRDKLLEQNDLLDNIEAGIKASYYTYLRDIYNNHTEYEQLTEPRKVAIYLFIREYCYSSMFRFNSDGKFNVPYGGVSYNNKTLQKKIAYYNSPELRFLLNNSELYNMDFYDFVNNIEINENDFMFLDPPYDTIFSEYDKNSFDSSDQRRLANYLINECNCRFMLIIKETDYINSLYKNTKLNIAKIPKKYFVSFKNRNKKDVTHLLITNY